MWFLYLFAVAPCYVRVGVDKNKVAVSSQYTVHIFNCSRNYLFYLHCKLIAVAGFFIFPLPYLFGMMGGRKKYTEAETGQKVCA